MNKDPCYWMNLNELFLFYIAYTGQIYPFIMQRDVK